MIPALSEVEAAVALVDDFRDRPAGTLRLNESAQHASRCRRSFLGFWRPIRTSRWKSSPKTALVDVLAAGSDAVIRYNERLEQDMIAVPIGARVQRFATAAAPAYLDRHGRPSHPRDLLAHDCLRGCFSSGALSSPWEFERAGEVVRVEPHGQLVVRVGAATDLAVEMAVAGVGATHLFENWLQPK